jgi:hypothetical protein
MAADTGFYAGASGGRSPIHSDNSQITLGLDLPQTEIPETSVSSHSLASVVAASGRQD